MTQPIPWIGVLVYFFLAVALSTPFRFNYWQWYRDLQLPAHLTVLKYVLEAVGPLVGSVVALYLFPPSVHTSSLLGSSAARSALAALVPLLSFMLIGAENPYGVDRHLFGLLLAGTVLLYCIFEEIGWRGYLQSALNPLPMALRTGIIGALWYLWHLTFLRGGFHLRADVIFIAALFFGSWGLGLTILKTRSIVLSACLHLTLNMILFNGLVGGIPMQQRLVASATSASVAAYLIATWPKPFAEVAADVPR